MREGEGEGGREGGRGREGEKEGVKEGEDRELNTSFTGEGELNGIASSATECINNEVALTTAGQVLSYLFRGGTKPTLW